MNFIDAVTVSGTKKRDDGALIVDARTARTGLQEYLGSEVGRPDLARVMVFRGADEVFSRDSLSSFAHRPITNDHPNEAVTADNWKTYAVGQTADEVTAQDIYVRVPLMVSDAKAIRDIEAGKRELSAGYSCDLDWTPGITKDGVHFDARQRNIRINHIAIVDAGRAGAKVRIGDYAAPLNQEPTKMTLKTITIDAFGGLPIEVTPAAETVINKLIADGAAVAATLATKDEEIGTLKAQVKTLTDAAAAVVKPDIDKLVADRVALVGTARTIVADVKIEGVSDADLRKAVVSAKLGEEMVKDASEAEVSGMFKALAKDVKAVTDPFRTAFSDQRTTPINTNDHGQSAYEKRLRDASKVAA